MQDEILKQSSESDGFTSEQDKLTTGDAQDSPFRGASLNLQDPSPTKQIYHSQSTKYDADNNEVFPNTNQGESSNPSSYSFKLQQLTLPVLTGGLGSLYSNPANSTGSKFSGEFRSVERSESVIVDNEKELLEKIQNSTQVIIDGQRIRVKLKKDLISQIPNTQQPFMSQNTMFLPFQVPQIQLQSPNPGGFNFGLMMQGLTSGLQDLTPTPMSSPFGTLSLPAPSFGVPESIPSTPFTASPTPMLFPSETLASATFSPIVKPLLKTDLPLQTSQSPLIDSRQGSTIKKTKSELPNASSGGAARIKVSSKYIVNNADDEPGKTESQEVEDLRKRVEAQQAEITRLKNQQRELSQFIVQHSSKKSIMKKIKDDNILEILEQSKISNAKIHLSFIFASPLVNFDDHTNEFHDMVQIDHNKESNGVINSLGKIGMQIKYQKEHATRDNITQILTASPIALHFSGHGLRDLKTSTSVFRGGSKDRNALQGYLVLENENGEASFLRASDLKKLLNEQGTQPEFVFVASCHSEFAGQIFHNAGAKHVICIREDQPISDDAAICFAKVFYNALFSSSKTVCEAFYIAQRHLSTHEDADLAREAQKFIILRSSDEEEADIDPTDLLGMNPSYISMVDPYKKKKHQCTIFGRFDTGSLTYVGKTPIFRIDTSKVEDFLGRTKEMHEVIKNINKKRIVNVKGVPGIGKTTLIKAVAHYLDERQIMKDGIIMLSLRNLDQASMILTRLELQISKKFNNFITDSEKRDDATKVVNQTAMLEKIATFFKDKHILLILDNAETPSKKDPKNFAEIIQTLLDECPMVSFLFTSRYNIGSFGCNSEQSIELKELDMSHAVELLKKKSSRPIEQSEIDDLLRVKPNKMLGFNPMGEQKGGLQNHHMFQILRGHPHAISLAGPLLKHKTLKELYDILNSDKIMNWLRSQDMKDSEMSSMTSLKVSMDISINQLHETNPLAIKLFWLIGLMPGGCNPQDLGLLWGDNWLTQAEKLLRSSLLLKKNLGEECVYQLFPFMNQYAETNMNHAEKKKLHEKIAKYLTDLCKAFLKQQSLETRLNLLVSIETNIWACIYRMRDQAQEQGQGDQFRARSPAPAPLSGYNTSSRATPLSHFKPNSTKSDESHDEESSCQPKSSSNGAKTLNNDGSHADGPSGSEYFNTLMGIDHLSGEGNDTHYQDRFDSMLSKRIYGLQQTSTKQRSKSEKVKKNLRSAQENRDQQKDDVDDDDDPQEGQEETVSVNQVLFTEKLSNSQLKDLQSDFNHDEEEKKSDFQINDHPDDKSFNESLIGGAPQLIRRKSLGEKSLKRLDNLIMSQTLGQSNSSLDISSFGNNQPLTSDQNQSSYMMMNQLQHQQLLNQSFQQDVAPKGPIFGSSGPSLFRPQVFIDDQSVINGQLPFMNQPQFLQAGEQFDTSSIDSLNSQLQQLNMSQTNQPSFMNFSQMNLNQSIQNQVRNPLNSSYSSQSQLNLSKRKQVDALNMNRPGLQINTSIILEESMVSYSELDEETPNIKQQQPKKEVQAIEEEMKEIKEECEENENEGGQNCLIIEEEKANLTAKVLGIEEDGDYLNQSFSAIGSDICKKEKDLEVPAMQGTIKPENQTSSKLEEAENESKQANQSGNMTKKTIPKRVTIQDDYNKSDSKNEREEPNEKKVMRDTSKPGHLKMKTIHPSMIPRPTTSTMPQPNSFHLIALQPGQIKGQVIMSVDGALIVYYATNLMMLGKYEDAVNLIDNFGVKLESDLMCQANLKKLQAFGICQKQTKNVDKTDIYKEANHKLNEALNLFIKLESTHGNAYCHFALGFLLFSQSSCFKIILKRSENKIFDTARELIEKSLNQYSTLRHNVGQSMCHKLLMHIKQKTRENVKEHFIIHQNLMRQENQQQQASQSRFIMLNGDSELSMHLEAIGTSIYHVPLAERLPTKIPRLTAGKNRKRSSSSRGSKSANRDKKNLAASKFSTIDKELGTLANMQTMATPNVEEQKHSSRPMSGVPQYKKKGGNDVDQSVTITTTTTSYLKSKKHMEEERSFKETISSAKKRASKEEEDEGMDLRGNKNMGRQRNENDLKKLPQAHLIPKKMTPGNAVRSEQQAKTNDRTKINKVAQSQRVSDITSNKGSLRSNNKGGIRSEQIPQYPFSPAMNDESRIISDPLPRINVLGDEDEDQASHLLQNNPEINHQKYRRKPRPSPQDRQINQADTSKISKNSKASSKQQQTVTKDSKQLKQLRPESPNQMVPVQPCLDDLVIRPSPIPSFEEQMVPQLQQQVSFSVTTTTTVKFEGQVPNGTLTIGPQVQITQGIPTSQKEEEQLFP